jgi:glycosyltransferase involved in cell wall biosynthesis
VTAGPQLTVAIPTYQGARHIAEALRGILAQEGVTFELLVCDDRSDDETVAIVNRLSPDRAVVSINSERLGLAGNWNRCVALSRTPYTAVFHQDDVMLPGHLAAHHAAFSARHDLGFVASAAEVIDAEGNAVPASVIERGNVAVEDQLFERGVFLEKLVVANPLRCSAVTVSKDAHTAVGGFDPALRYVVDWEFWIRVARRYPVAWLAKPSVAVRWHTESETHRFKHGVADLEEAVTLVRDLNTQDGPRLAERRRLSRLANQRLSRAFLNRAYDAARSREIHVVRTCLRRAVQLWPGILGVIAADPRLGARLASAALFSRR